MAKSVRLLSGKSIPLIGFGTYKINGYDSVYAALDAALNSGYRLIDTAQRYENEAEIGRALKHLLPKHGLKRRDVFITSKLNRGHMSSDKAGPAIEQSLRNLQTDYLDLFLLHFVHPYGMENNDPRIKDFRCQSWRTLEQFHEKETLRTIGVSNFEIRHIDELLTYARVKPSVNQCEFHPHFCRRDLVNECKKRNIHFQAYSPLGRNNENLMNEQILLKLASKYEVNVSQLILAWSMHFGISVVPKSANPKRIQENFSSVKVRLSSEDAESIWNLHKFVSYATLRPWEAS